MGIWERGTIIENPIEQRLDVTQLIVDSGNTYLPLNFTLLGTITYPHPKDTFEDDLPNFPFGGVGYVIVPCRVTMSSEKETTFSGKG